MELNADRYTVPTIETTSTGRGAFFRLIVPDIYEYAGELVADRAAALALAQAHANAPQLRKYTFVHVPLTVGS